MNSKIQLNQKKEWTIIDLINWSTKYLQSKNISNSRKESEWFLSYIYKCNRLELYLQFDKIVEDSELKIFKSYILRRLKQEPFQYIINKAPFYGRDFYVDKNVLIPRPETETIIEILKKQNVVKSILDIGTGSGCLAITLLIEKIAKKILAIDKFDNSISIAKKNASYYKCKNIIFQKMNILKSFPKQQFDLVISNPPYISINELKTLDKNIIEYEPISSLTDYKDGLLFFQRFNEIYDKIISPKGKLILEFGGEKQINSLKKIFNPNIYNLCFYSDLNHEKRILEIIKK